MTPADQHYATPAKPQKPSPADYEGAVIGIISKILLVLSLALATVAAYSLL